MTRAMTAELKPFSAELRKSQTESLKAAEAMTKLAQSELKRAENLRRAYDDTYANAQRYLKVEEAVAHQMELRNLSTEQGNVILAGAAKRYDQMGKHAQAANQNVKLTGGQIQNLSYQLNDTATMLLMGASPFQILASQGGQVVQALGDGPQGVRGSLTAIGSSIASFARSIPVAGYAVAGATAAVGALWYATSGPGAREAEETIKDFEDGIKRIETGWKAAADAAREYAKAPGRQETDINATFLEVQGSIGRLTKDLRAQIDDLNTSDLLSGKILRPFSGSVSDARREITTLYTDLRQGEISAQQFADEMLRIRLDPNADDYARNFAEEIRRSLGPVMELERQVQALNQAASQLAAPKGTMGRHDLPDDVFHDRFGSTIGGDGRFGDSAGMDAIRDALRSQRDEMSKRATDNWKAEHELAMRAITARTAAEKAEIEAQRTRLSLMDQNLSASELDARAEAARALSLAESSEAYRQTQADAAQNMQDRIDQMRMEASLYGESEGAAACLPAEMMTVDAARKEANK
ncbi:phage tail length tape measure family protein [Aureimonas sp. ME7]|uniref:phage tail length tape measure family protein n=1 Tax=Aureimonas sp. ME7 TaxID=2744252 RepID=UPI0015FBE09A|nr:phage tail length tape measure family protein [Aureimonas sp. ME7]